MPLLWKGVKISTCSTFDEGHVTTGATFMIDQTLAEILCILTDWQWITWRKFNNLRRPLFMGWPSIMKQTKQMVLSKYYNVQKLKQKLTMCESINFMVTTLTHWVIYFILDFFLRVHKFYWVIYFILVFCPLCSFAYFPESFISFWYFVLHEYGYSLIFSVCIC